MFYMVITNYHTLCQSFAPVHPAPERYGLFFNISITSYLDHFHKKFDFASKIQENAEKNLLYLS